VALAGVLCLATFSPVLAADGAVGPAAVTTLRLYLHGEDIPGTLTGFTMNTTPAGSDTLVLDLLEGEHWYSQNTLTGHFTALSRFSVQFPCLIGLSVAPVISLHRTDVNGGSPTLIAERDRVLGLCLGFTRAQLPRTVPGQITLSNQRLRLSFKTALAAVVNLRLGRNTFLQGTNFNT
jgi:hypothetical protein